MVERLVDPPENRPELTFIINARSLLSCHQNLTSSEMQDRDSITIRFMKTEITTWSTSSGAIRAK
jgi:hypothetical protein